MSSVEEFKSNPAIQPFPLPPPPPPPPPYSLSPPVLEPKNLVGKVENSMQYEEQVQFALDHVLGLNENFTEIYHMSNVELEPQIQVGPKCGLVALSIATSLHQRPVSVDMIFEKALQLGYTKQGEIFNVQFLADLAKHCGFTTQILTRGLHAHVDCIIHHLLHKNLILVPYDADHNHSPCCKKGHKAHWAVISGFLIATASTSIDGVVMDSSRAFQLCHCVRKKSADGIGGVTHFVNNGKLLLTRKAVKDLNEISYSEGKLYLIGRQGKSKHVGIWQFDEMAESNDNLMFFSTERSIDEYVLPEGGLVEGLKARAVILQSTETNR